MSRTAHKQSTDGKRIAFIRRRPAALIVFVLLVAVVAGSAWLLTTRHREAADSEESDRLERERQDADDARTTRFAIQT